MEGHGQVHLSVRDPSERLERFLVVAVFSETGESRAYCAYSGVRHAS